MADNSVKITNIKSINLNIINKQFFVNYNFNGVVFKTNIIWGFKINRFKV